MSLESNVTTIDTLNPLWPTGTDPASHGDDHIRNLKFAVQSTFPNIAGVVTATHADLNKLVNPLSMADQLSTNVSVTGGSLSGITINSLAAPLSIADGGTGATNVTDMILNFGLVATWRQIITGNGLTGGGNLASNKTISVVPSTGISVSASGVAVDTTKVPLLDAAANTFLGNVLAERFRAQNGTAGAPSIAFANDANSGLYIEVDNANAIAFSAGGTKRGSVGPSGWEGAGSLLTDLDAGNIASGTLNTNRLPADVVKDTLSVSSGNGLTGGGRLTTDRTINLGTPSSITTTSVNESTGSTHTHFIGAITIRELTAMTSANNVGSYAILFHNVDYSALSRNSTIAGSALSFSNVAGHSTGGTAAGTWRLMGEIPSGNNNTTNTSLWLRIS